MMTDGNVELQDPFYHSDVFMMFCFKILPCKKTYRHDWRVCPFAHGDETAKRRDPRICKYTGVICPDAKKGRSCPRGDECPCTHSLFEYWLHPTRFKTEICSRGSRCIRPFCFFAHKQTEIRKPNFRIQMQGLTCEPMKLNTPSLGPVHRFNTGGGGTGHCSVPSEHCCATIGGAMNRLSLLDGLPLLQSARSRVSVDGGSTSVQDSGSSCDFEMSCATWNSRIGGATQGDAPPSITRFNNNNMSKKDSPRLETVGWSNQPLLNANNSSVPALSMPLRPMFPQIPSLEQNSVDWYGIPLKDSNLHLSARGMSNMRNSQSWRLGGIAGEISPRLLEPTNDHHHLLPRSSFLEEPLISNLQSTDSSSNSGYDRSFLLATIQDVYQSMVTGSSQLQSNDRNTSEFLFQGEEERTPVAHLVQPLTYGTDRSTASPGKMTQTNALTINTTNVGGGNACCGIEGLQQYNNNNSPAIVSDPNQNFSSVERMISTLLQTDLDSAPRYFY